MSFSVYGVYAILLHIINFPFSLPKRSLQGLLRAYKICKYERIVMRVKADDCVAIQTVQTCKEPCFKRNHQFISRQRLLSSRAIFSFFHNIYRRIVYVMNWNWFVVEISINQRKRCKRYFKISPRARKNSLDDDRMTVFFFLS